MALVLTNAFLEIDAIDCSGETNSIALHVSASTVDVSTMGNDGYQDNEGGIKSFSLAADVMMDESTMGALFDKVGKSVAIEVRADAGVVSETNPSYTGSGILTEYAPVDASFGEAQKMTLTITGSGALIRSTTAV